MTETLRLAIPSTGALEQGAVRLLADADASVSRVQFQTLHSRDTVDTGH